MANQVNKASKFFGTSPLETTKELRNVASKNAEDELITYKGKSPSKNYLNRNDVIISIDAFKSEYNNLNSRKNTPNFQKKFEEFKLKYPKLSKWRELSRKLENLRESGREHFRKYGEYSNNNSVSNSNTNYNNTLEGKINGFNVKAILRKTPQPPTLYNRLTKRFTKKNTTKSYLPTQQNPQNNSSIRPATPVTPVTPVSKPWYQLWGGTHHKSHHKKRHMRKGSRKIHRK